MYNKKSNVHLYLLKPVCAEKSSDTKNLKLTRGSLKNMSL